MTNKKNRLTEANIETAKRMKSEGHTYKEIGPVLGVSKQAVWSHLSKPEIKAEIEEMQKEFLSENLPVAKEVMTQIIRDGGRVDNQRYKACERVLESAGMLPSMVGSVFIQNLNHLTNKSSDSRINGHLSETCSMQPRGPMSLWEANGTNRHSRHAR